MLVYVDNCLTSSRVIRSLLFLQPYFQLYEANGRFRFLRLLHIQECVNLVYSFTISHLLDAGWKRLLLADGPRQTINALTLYAFYLSKKGKGSWWDLSKYFDGNDLITSALTVSTAFTVLVFAGSVLLLIVAGVCYIPLLCHIQGNLKVSRAI